jgi:SulP family sulfate permease
MTTPLLSLRFFSSFRGWISANAGRDILAGLTLAAITIPEQMATARLGGFDPQIGFLAFMGATLGFVIFGASRVLTAGADSTITPIFAGSLAVMAASGSASLASASVTLAWLVGLMLIAGGIFKLGWIANLLSKPVLTGFLAGIAIHILVSQLPSVLGIAGSGGSLMARILAVASRLASVNPFTAVIGFGVPAVMLIAERVDRRIPGAIVGIVLATSAVLLFGLEGRGVAVLGSLPQALPRLIFPAVEEWRTLLPLALIITLIVMMQTAAVIHSFPGPTQTAPNANFDFVGVGAGNLVAALFGAFPVNASPPRTAVVAEAGGTSQLGALTAAAIVLVLALWGGSLLAHVPQAALAGVLVFVAQRIFRLDEMATIARQAPHEFVLVILTAIAMTLLPIEAGAAIGIGLSLLHGVWMTIHTRVLELYRLPGTTIWWPSGERGAEERLKGVAVFAYQAPLLFANAQTFKAGMLAVIDREGERPSLIVLEASGIADIDFTAAQAMKEVITRCRARGIRFAIARLESVRAQDAIGRFGILTVLGANHLFHSVEEAVTTLSSGRG